MVCKGVILFRVQYLQQGAGRVSAVVSCQLVHFIQHHNRVRGAAAFHAFHNPAGHGSHISPSVATDFCFIPDSAQTDTHIFSPQSLSNTLANTGFTGTRRSYKEQDRAGLLSVQGHNGKLLDNSFFYLFQAVMVLIQNLFCFFKVDFAHTGCLPGKGCDKVQIIIKHTIFMTFLSFLAHAV